ncbi:MAG: site-specific DNA-methyltransferase [Gemmatimonadetes bacterium]|nr:site-specific DNA-methyltransferase [Gemmatimonadota bacterium]
MTAKPTVTPITANDPEAQSADVVGGNIERLKELFPDAFVEGKVDFEVLKQLLGGAVDERPEKYGLNWHGKRQARQLALTPSMGTLRPCPEESVDWDTTQNLMIEGDNLEVLKLLQKSYAGKVKLIYIDPPYNTGKDFVYPDNFRDSIQNYLEITGQVEGGAKVSSNAETSGRYHTDWLNMMYPRLKLARDLLQDDGVIFISIDDHEVQHLRGLCDEVFGPENFVATIIWQKVFSPKNSAKHLSVDHDYVVVYAHNGEAWRPVLLQRTAEMEARYSNPDQDPRGPWTSGDVSARNYYGLGTYAVKTPSGRVIDGPPAGRYWAISREKFEELDRDGRVWWGAQGNNMPRLKRFLSEVQDGKVPQTLWLHTEAGNTQEAKKELLGLVPIVNADAVFDTPKPRRLVQRMLEISTSAEARDLVVDFFGGSGTTADAVLHANAKDGGNRRFICVQLPSRLEVAAQLSDGRAIETLSGITKERLARAGDKVRADQPMFAGDLGFRVYKMDSSSIAEWDASSGDVESTLLSAVENIKPGRTERDVLVELLLKLGLDLCVPIEERLIGGKKVHAIGGGTLVACLDTALSATDAEAVALGIVEWLKELKPTGDVQCVFRDSAFADDVAKTNLAAILAQNGVTNVRSL